MAVAGKTWNVEADVVVVGTGGAALTAAILARDQGAQVLVVERSDKVGGTTAVSGGVIWIPLNHHMGALGVTDSREEALTYCKRLAAGRASDDLVETFVDAGDQMVRYLEEHSAARFCVWPTPDDYCELPGGKANGRSLEPELFSTKGLGEWAEKLRPAPMFTLPVTMTEAYTLLTTPEQFSMDLIKQRTEDGMVGCGRALIGWLLKACLDRGINIVLQTRGRQLIRHGRRIVGLRAEQDGRDFSVRARRGVVLACGGYEWNEALTQRFLPGPITHPLSPPFNEGDGLLMAMEIGADLANMDEALWIPAGTVPGETYEGRQLTRFIASEKSGAHAIVVNRYGRRFANEGLPHKGMGYAQRYFDPHAAVYDYPNLPSWAVFDQQYREKQPILTLMPSVPDPAWLTRSDTLEGLARYVGIDPEGLQATVARWNEFARQGKDQDFKRGETAIEQFGGNAPGGRPNLGSIEKPPFYALPVHAGALGTSGGPRTNAKGQVLNVSGEVIPGLYAAGTVAASPTGRGYYGNGGSIGPAMTWGYICGINVAAVR